MGQNASTKYPTRHVILTSPSPLTSESYIDPILEFSSQLKYYKMLVVTDSKKTSLEVQEKISRRLTPYERRSIRITQKSPFTQRSGEWSRKDLDTRFKFPQAEAAFFLANSSSLNSSTEDLNMLQIVKEFRKSCQKTPIFCQCFNASNVEALKQAGATKVLSMQSLRLKFMVNSALSEGFSSLLGSLICSYEERDIIDYSGRSVGLSYVTSAKNNKLYTVDFSPCFNGMGFIQVAEQLFHRFHIILIGIRSKEKYGEGRIVLNPSTTEMDVPISTKSHQAVVLAQRKDHAQEVSNFTLAHPLPTSAAVVAADTGAASSLQEFSILREGSPLKNPVNSLFSCELSDFGEDALKMDAGFHSFQGVRCNIHDPGGSGHSVENLHRDRRSKSTSQRHSGSSLQVLTQRSSTSSSQKPPVLHNICPSSSFSTKHFLKTCNFEDHFIVAGSLDGILDPICRMLQSRVSWTQKAPRVLVIASKDCLRSYQRQLDMKLSKRVYFCSSDASHIINETDFKRAGVEKCKHLLFFTQGMHNSHLLSQLKVLSSLDSSLPITIETRCTSLPKSSEKHLSDYVVPSKNMELSACGTIFCHSFFSRLLLQLPRRNFNVLSMVHSLCRRSQNSASINSVEVPEKLVGQFYDQVQYYYLNLKNCVVVAIQQKRTNENGVCQHVGNCRPHVSNRYVTIVNPDNSLRVEKGDRLFIIGEWSSIVSDPIV